MYVEVLAVQGRVLGAEHPDTLATKEDGNISVTTKHRLVLDPNLNDIARAIAKRERVLLPRSIGAAFDILEILDELLADSEDVEMLLRDCLEAFWQLPAHHMERRFQLVWHWQLKFHIN